jgi:predicted glycoside hydrolase/deacetylase ChbG (UPF0249 family)
MPRAAGENRLENQAMSANNGTAQIANNEVDVIESEQLASQQLDCVAALDEALGIYAVSDYKERAWVKVYYALREMQGKFLRRQYGESFNWELFKAQYSAVFGTETDRKVSLEMMLEYAHVKFNKSLDEMIAANVQSFQRREEWKRKQEQEFYQDYNPNWQ